MSAWDWLPGVSGALKIADGDIGGGLFNIGADVFTGGLYTPVSKLAKKGYNAYTGAQDELRKGYQNAVTGLREEAEKQRQFQMEGLNRAQSYYEPAAAMNMAAYGSPGKLRK